MAWQVLESAVKFEAALEAFRKRVPISDEDFEALLDANHQNAFKVAHAQSLQLVFDVWQALDKAVEGGAGTWEEGYTFEDFKKDVGEKLRKAWVPLKLSEAQEAHRVATVFRNGVQSSFSHGRWVQMESPKLKSLRPYRLFDAIRDGRTTKVCRKAHKTLLPADHPWWNNHVPQLHHACRSTVRSIRAAVARRRGITVDPTDEAPQEGFGARPNVASPVPEPPPVDLTKYPPELRRIYEAKLAEAA